MMLVDANILMYAGGREHPNKAPSVEFLRRVAVGEIEATLDAEVLQEIIHRYRALNRWPEGKQIFALSRRLFPEVLAITGPVMDRAKELADTYKSISARDAIHAAVVLHYKLEGICSFDTHFDDIRGCRRVGMSFPE